MENDDTTISRRPLQSSETIQSIRTARGMAITGLDLDGRKQPFSTIGTSRRTSSSENSFEVMKEAASRDQAEISRRRAINNNGSQVDRGREELVDPLPDALSNSLLNVAREARTAFDSAGDSSNSANEDDEGATGNIVTATNTTATATTTTTATTSSGDDRDSSGGNASGGGMTVDDHSGSSKQTPTQARHHHHHHHHRGRQSHRSHGNDGSVLQLPQGDGTHRVVRGGHASVVASRFDAASSATSMMTSNTNTSSSSSSGSVEGDAGQPTRDGNSLLQPHREPGLHTIRMKFGKLPKKRPRTATRPSTADSPAKSSSKKTTKKPTCPTAELKAARPKKSPSKERRGGRGSPSPGSVDSNTTAHEGTADGGSTSGSGTEGGYVGSASSNERGQDSSSSSEESRLLKIHHHHHHHKSKRHFAKSSADGGPMGVASGVNAEDEDKQQDSASTDSSSSEIADFSSGEISTSNGEEGGGGRGRFTIKGFIASASPSLSSSDSNGEEGSSSDDLEGVYMRAATRRKVLEDSEQRRLLETTTRKRKSSALTIMDDRKNKASLKSSGLQPRAGTGVSFFTAKVARLNDSSPPIMSLGSDIMAHVLTFLQPPEILDVLTMPLSKEWRQNFTVQPELWRVLCLVDPFKAQMEEEDAAADGYTSSTSSNSDSFCSLTEIARDDSSRRLNRYRLLYTSFVRCMKYLSQIREDAVNGRPPSYIDYGVAGASNSSNKSNSEAAPNGNERPAVVTNNQSFRQFLAQASDIVHQNMVPDQDGKDEGEDVDDDEEEGKTTLLEANTLIPIAKSKKRKFSGAAKKGKKEKRPRFGNSIITERMLGPSASGEPGNLNLPWSCAIYSIVNWMVTFCQVEGIQTLCMKVLPFLLEDEQQRMTAQRAGLTDVVLRAMVLFPDSVQLHIAAFHTMVLLARPMGGREGMIFHSSMIASGIFGGGDMEHRKNGVAVMLDSMKRFEDSEALQAMCCWALVNVALAPMQKAVLVKLGGIQATTQAMLRHPFSAEVQYRALFALINLVIPSVRLMNADNIESVTLQEQLGEVNSISEKEIIDELVTGIANLAVTAMKNFCSSEAILNRACLVLHNLSLTQDYHTTLLWTPHCYQMLEWCLANYRTDQVLQQSAAGTLHRLQITMSNDEELRTRFSMFLRSQQQISLQQAHQEAVRLSELQGQQEENNSNNTTA